MPGRRGADILASPLAPGGRDSIIAASAGREEEVQMVGSCLRRFGLRVVSVAETQ